MAKTKFIRVAVSGSTIDGRTIDPAQLQQAATNYNRDTYAARLNLEHIRGITGDKPFMAYGDVLSLKTDDVELDIAGKKEKRLGLFAELEVSDELVELNKKGQKLYSSIEIIPNFSNTNQAYLAGIAVTDSPASLGTQRLQFNVFGGLTATPAELNLEVAEAPAPTAAQAAATDAFAAMKTFFSSFTKPAEQEVKPEPKPDASPDFATFTASLTEGFTKMSAAIEASAKANNEAVTKVANDLAAFKAQVETTPAASYSARPPVSGGGAASELSDF